MFLKNFLETAEQHFFINFNVHMYVFTDRTKDVPQVKMAAGRQVIIIIEQELVQVKSDEVKESF